MTKSVLVFTFSHFTKDDVMKEKKDLDVSKPSQKNGISSKIIEENADIFSSFTYQSFNNMIVCFPYRLFKVYLQYVGLI